MATQNASPEVKKALDYFSANETRFLDELKSLVRIPSCSFAGYPAAEVRRCAQAVAAQMKDAGLDGVEILEMEGAHPYVYGEWLKAPGKPTVLLYAHYDVQPVGDEAKWQSPPYEPTVRDGRMYARGSADDKAGISVHLAAIASFLKTSGKLPINVKVLIEGEEETGSEHLGDFVQKHREKLKSDAMVLTDTANFDTGIPTLTVSLRGLVSLEVEVKALGHSLHSGLWGGPVPDPAMALSKMLASLVDDKGNLAIPEMLKSVRPVTAEEKKAFRELPYNEKDFREQTSILDGVPLRPGFDGTVSVYQQLWREPSVSVNAMEVASRTQAGNIVPASAWARVGIRIVPDMDPELICKMLTDHLIKVTPWGLKTTIKPEGAGRAWSTQSKGPAFAAAMQALELGYEKKPVLMGCGASIPFVEPLSDALGGIPALLMGVEDPYTNPHSENESLHLGDWRKAIVSAVHFYDLYAKL